MTLNLLFKSLGLSNIGKIRDGRKVFLVGTDGFDCEIPFDVQLKMVEIALTELVGEVTWVIFKDCEERYLEDQGRTCVFPLSLLDEDCKTEVYAILDDYGSVEVFQQVLGKKFFTNTQYKLTFLLPEEY